MKGIRLFLGKKKKTDSWSEAENGQDFHPVVSESKEAVVGTMGAE